MYPFLKQNFTPIWLIMLALVVVLSLWPMIRFWSDDMRCRRGKHVPGRVTKTSISIEQHCRRCDAVYSTKKRLQA